MRKYIAAGLCFLCSAGLFSQQQEGKRQKETAVVDSWYIRLEAGTQILFSSDASNLDFGDRFTPSLSLSGGKWFSPYWGAWMQMDGYALNGFSTLNGRYTADPLPGGEYGTYDPVREEVMIRPDGTYRHYIRYINANVGLQASAVNLIAGYNPNRRWDVIPAAGIGYYRTIAYMGIPGSNNLSGVFSLTGKYTVWQNLDALLEVSTTLLPEKFDGRLTDRNCENSLAIRLGVVYNFKSEVEYKPLKSLCELMKREKKPARKQERAAAHVIERTQIVTELLWDTVMVEKVIEKPLVGKRDPFVLSSIQFELGKDMASYGQEVNYVNIVNYLDSNPESKIRLEGYGDRAIGTADDNMKVSIKRIEHVRSTLIKKYDISPDRIEAYAIGSTSQPYEENSWNRVVVVVAVE